MGQAPRTRLGLGRVEANPGGPSCSDPGGPASSTRCRLPAIRLGRNLAPGWAFSSDPDGPLSPGQIRSIAPIAPRSIDTMSASIIRELPCRVSLGSVAGSPAESTAPRPSSMSQAPGSGQTDCPRPGHRQDHLLVYPAPGHCSEHPDPLLGGISSIHPTPTYINISANYPRR